MIINAPAVEQVPELRQLWKEAFGDTDAFLDCFFSCAFHPERSRCITVDGCVAAALYWFDGEWEGKPIAYLYAVATRERFRGRGLCRALMEDTHGHLKDLGYQGSILVPVSPVLFEMYGKLGYSTCCYVREFTCTAGEKAVALRRLSREEYGRLRRSCLPKGGVVQEGQTLALLQTQAAFYAGENMLFTAAEDKGTLVIGELLGDGAAAPGILTALGCSRGKVRTPGGKRPFAMYHSLTDRTGAPEYFGLALD